MKIPRQLKGGAFAYPDTILFATTWKSEMNATSSPKCETENLNTNIHVRSQH